MDDIEIIWTTDDELLGGDDSFWEPGERVIYMDARLKQVTRRCALAHELAHIVRGDEGCDDERQGLRQEIAAEALAARWLLPDLDELAKEIVASASPGEAAETLWVTLDIFQARMDHLHPAERHYLRREIARRMGL